MKSNLTTRPLEEKEFADELAPGVSLLQGQYVIEAHLNSGGFGITYLAKDSLHRRVVIKECFMGAFCRRSNMIVGVRTRAHAKEFNTIVELFVQEARQLARLRHPNIVGVHQVFRDNETAYMALDYVEGRDLLEILEDPSAKLNPKNVQDITIKLLDAIEFVHGQGVLHRDISPDNILLTKSMEPVLIDFGAARETATRKTRLLGAMRAVKDGYSPQEFYLSDAEQHPCSDLYSLGASLYHLISGTPPPNAQERLSSVASGEEDPYVPISQLAEKGYSPSFLEAIDQALNVFPKHRIQSAADWRAQITHTSPNSATRGSVSRPMLAVDNGNVVTHIRELVRDDQMAAEKETQVATEDELVEAGLVSEKKKMPTRKGRANKSGGAVRPQRPQPNANGNIQFTEPSKKSGKSMGLVAAAALLAVAGGAAYFTMSGSDEQPDRQAALAPAATAPAATTPAVPAEAPARQAAAAPAIETPVPAEEDAVAGLSETAADDLPRATPLDPSVRPPARPDAAAQDEPAVVAEPAPEPVGNAPAVTADIGAIAAVPAEPNDIALNVEADVNGSHDAPSGLSAPEIETQPSIDVASPPPPPRSEPGAVIDVSSVISGPAIAFPFTTDANDPSLILTVDANAPDFLRSGLRIVSVNGFPVENLADAQQVVKVTRDLRVGSDVGITLGLKDTRTGTAIARPIDLQTVQETFLLNGINFRTQLVGGEWKTIVVEAVDRGNGSLKVGDEVVALMPTSEVIDTPASLVRIINRELAENTTKFNFAVRRNGEMYLVSMNYSGSGN